MHCWCHSSRLERWGSREGQQQLSKSDRTEAAMASTWLPCWGCASYDDGDPQSPETSSVLKHALHCTTLHTGTLFLSLAVWLNLFFLQSLIQILLLPSHRPATLGPPCHSRHGSTCFAPVPHNPLSSQSNLFKSSVITQYFPAQNSPVASCFHWK